MTLALYRTLIYMPAMYLSWRIARTVVLSQDTHPWKVEGHFIIPFQHWCSAASPKLQFLSLGIYLMLVFLACVIVLIIKSTP